MAGQTPRDYIFGIIWENADGLTSNRKIIVAKYSKSYPSNNVVETSNIRAAWLVRHEYGHAIDKIYKVSDNSYFTKSYNEDAQEIKNNSLIESSDELDYAL